tara:strand:- start:266 stop:505 length:240 start_codon:yes stop_codon:yes gene_type:complete
MKKHQQSIRFSEVQFHQLNLFRSKTKVSNNTEALHLAVQYGLKYFEFVTQALETTNFEVALLRKTKYYGSETDTSYKKF